MNWKIKNKNNEFNSELGDRYHPIVLEILAGRGLRSVSEVENYFDFDYEKNLGHPFKAAGMEKAAERIMEARHAKEKVAIFGDYDADGVSASALLFETLSELGFEEVSCYIPDRQSEGYGMNEKAVEYLADRGVKLIITVDCGITNVKEIAKAKEAGMDVIVTDHHHVPEKIPEACAILNPNVSDSGFQCRELAGVGVAFKLAQALYYKMAPEKIEQLKWTLDLVAIGTIADCVPLLGENRVLAKYGLIVISKTRRRGLLEMFQVGRMDISENKVPNSHQVAFQIAPRINAAGRMDHANAAYNLLIEKDAAAARNLALDLEKQNQDRQKVTTEIFREVEILAQNSFKDKNFIFAENPHWPVGLLGLVAGKIMSQLQKPTAIFQKREDVFVGSLRSIPEVNIVGILEQCRELLLKFGGHAQAAGVSIRPENIEAFYEKAAGLIEKELEGREISPAIEIDREISPADIDWDLAADLAKMEPFGAGNEQPVFCARRMVVVDAKVVGNGQKHWKLSLRGETGGPKIFDAIGFSLVEKFPDLKKDDKIDIVFNLEEDEWNGNKKIQLKLIDLEIIGHKQKVVGCETSHKLLVIGDSA